MAKTSVIILLAFLVLASAEEEYVTVNGAADIIQSFKVIY